MTGLELDLATLRARRQSTGLVAWIRGLRPFDRRSIRDPDLRDAWVNVQRRLAESDAAFLTRYDPYGSTERQRRNSQTSRRSVAQRVSS